jgi:hypothetical protein
MDDASSTSTTSSNPSEIRSRDAANWAQDGTHLRVSAAPQGAINLNVEGRNVVGPLQGFGRMWQKTYRVNLTEAGITPKQVIAAWKSNFQNFWPQGNRFYMPITGITPGEVALLNLKTSGMPLSTGVLVLYADDESFTLMTPQGHMFAGWITFSSYQSAEQVLAQALVLMRAGDPIYELGLSFGGHQQEDKFWRHTLSSLASFFGVTTPVEMETLCVDKHLQWRHTGNIRHNAAVRTVLTTPARWFGRGGNRSTSTTPGATPTESPRE